MIGTEVPGGVYGFIMARKVKPCPPGLSRLVVVPGLQHEFHVNLQPVAGGGPVKVIGELR